MTTRVEIGGEALAAMDKELAGLLLVSRMPAIKKGLRAAGNIVRKRTRETVPKPGYPGDKPGLKALRDTVSTKIKEYESGKVLAMVGYEWGDGSHGHLVEEGHRMVVGGKVDRQGEGKIIEAPAAVLKAMGRSPSGSQAGRVVGFVEGGHYLEHAARATESEQAAAIADVIQEAIEQAKR